MWWFVECAALVVTEEENRGNQDWAAWRDILHLFDIICCCAILFPIVWSIKSLREAAATVRLLASPLLARFRSLLKRGCGGVRTARRL